MCGECKLWCISPVVLVQVYSSLASHCVSNGGGLGLVSFYQAAIWTLSGVLKLKKTQYSLLVWPFSDLLESYNAFTWSQTDQYCQLQCSSIIIDFYWMMYKICASESSNRVSKKVQSMTGEWDSQLTWDNPNNFWYGVYISYLIVILMFRFRCIYWTNSVNF